MKMTGAGRTTPIPQSYFHGMDSWLDQRKRRAFGIQRGDGLVNSLVERVRVSEGLMPQMMRLEIAPDGFDVVQFRRILGQPLDGEPVRAGGQRGQGELAGVDRTIVLDQHHRLDGMAGPGTIKAIQLLEVGDKVAATLRRTGVHAESA